MVDAIVVGGGIVGATISAALRLNGVSVTTLDDARALAGTPPSGGHLKPSWFGGMKKTEYEPAMELLDKVWGLKEEEFRIQPLKVPCTVYRVDTDLVVAAPKTVARVVKVLEPTGKPTIKTKDGTEYRPRILVIATGVWANELVPEIRPVAKQGVSFRLRGVLKYPLIRPWAPYKQVVAHQQGPNEVWAGDGSALLAANWTDQRTAQCLDRCLRYTGLTNGEGTRTMTGLRPYLQTGTDPCLLKRLGTNTWVVTGAGKSGTIAAGWAAKEILRAL